MTPLLHVVLPVPIPSLNRLLATHYSKHPSKQQERALEAALGWWCYCGAPAIPSQLKGRHWMPVAPPYCCDVMRPPTPRPTRKLRDPQDLASWYLDLGQPTRQLDVLLARIPRAGRGKRLDGGDNDSGALKHLRDVLTRLLWPYHDRKPDDSDGLFRWCYGQRERREGDPPNRGTELLEVVVAEREDVMAPVPAVLVGWEAER
jgi:hypothetical protein